MILCGSPKIQEITERGLRGEITFEESLNQRLAIASPTRQQVIDFGEKADQYLTKGMEALIKNLIDAGVDVWIFSGGIKESIVPLAIKLGIPKSKVLAIQVQWNDDGTFGKVIPPYGKHEFPATHSLPAIAVGDSMSDYLLYQNGVVDDFILYTEHFLCDEILEKGVKVASSVSELTKLLDNVS